MPTPSASRLPPGMLTATARSAWSVGVAVVSAWVHQHIGVVPQRVTLDRGLNVGDNMVVHGRYFGMLPPPPALPPSGSCNR